MDYPQFASTGTVVATGIDGPIESNDGGKTWTKCPPSTMVWVAVDPETLLWIAHGFGTYGEGISALAAVEDLVKVARKREPFDA